MRLKLTLIFSLIFSTVLFAQDDPFLDLPMMNPKDQPDPPPVKQPDNKPKDPTVILPAVQSPIVPVPSPPVPDPVDPTDVPIPPPVLYGEEILSESDSLYYVIDISGSMGWAAGSYIDLDGTIKSGNRLDKAKVELKRSIMSLPPNFKFNIVAFSCVNFLWQPFLQPANDISKQAAMAWVSTLQPLGNTGTGPATALSLGDKNNQTVLLLTDGEPNCPIAGTENHRQMIRNQNTQGARINVFGIQANGVWREFCLGVAADSGGSYHDIQ